MNSSISAARVGLFAKLVAGFEDDTAVQVEFGPPGAYEEQEVVALLGVVDPDEEPAAIGQRHKEEVYSLEVGVKAHDPAGTAQSVDLRGFTIADGVRGVVADNITLSGAVRTALVTSQTTDGAVQAEGGGWVIFIRILIECHQRIAS